MRLKVMAPAKIVADRDASKVVAKSPDGYFCLLPHHVDFVSELIPGILSLEDGDGREESFAIDEGILVKCGDEVLVATRSAYGEIPGRKIDPAEAESRMAPDGEEARCREIVAGMESEFVNRFLKED
ncbi:MAG: F0F1 ATP synthase subunit epsilon [Thermoleophilia bacterium]